VSVSCCSIYTTSHVPVLWSGLVSDYFSVSNGVKQGGVISPILFCVYIDDLVLKLSSSGVGCYFGLNFVGTLAYICWRHRLTCTNAICYAYILLQICDSYAAEYDINFNPDKSMFFVIPANKRHHMYNAVCNCSFFVRNVDWFSHLGNIITSSLIDGDDIVQRRNTLVDQTNNFLCFFNKLNTMVNVKLFKSYCTSIFGPNFGL